MINAKRVLIVLCFSLLWACTRPASGLSPSAEISTIETISINGTDRSYRLYRPQGSVEGMPLLIGLHGLGGTAAFQERLSGASNLADLEGFVVAYPEGELLGRQQAWRVGPGSPDVGFLTLLARHLIVEFNLDPNRIYLAGHSNGGGMVHRAACEASDVFAAVAGVAGAYPSGPVCDPEESIAVIAFHSLDDPVVPYQGSAQTLALPEWAAGWAQRNACAVRPESSLLNGAVEVANWNHCLQDVEVTLVTVDGDGHRWSGGPGAEASVNATEIMWAFFEAHSKGERGGLSPES